MSAGLALEEGVAGQAANGRAVQAGVGGGQVETDGALAADCGARAGRAVLGADLAGEGSSQVVAHLALEAAGGVAGSAGTSTGGAGAGAYVVTQLAGGALDGGAQLARTGETVSQTLKARQAGSVVKVVSLLALDAD